MKKIRVIGLDGDGCIFNQKFISILSEDIQKFGINSLQQSKIFEMVLLANIEFFEILKKENKKYNKTILCIASNRQSHHIDFNNSEKFLKNILNILGLDSNNINSQHVYMLSFTRIMDILSDFLLLKNRGDYFESTLLADLFGFDDINHNPDDEKKFNSPLTPTTAGNISIITPEFYNHPDSPLDYSKTLLLCNLLRKIRIDNPNAEIVFDMFDDRCSLDNPALINLKSSEISDDSLQSLTRDNTFPNNISGISMVSSSLEVTPNSTSRQGSPIVINENTPTLDLVAHYMSRHKELLNKITLNLFFYNGQEAPELFQSINYSDKSFNELEIDDYQFAEIIQKICSRGKLSQSTLNAGEKLILLSSLLYQQNSSEINSLASPIPDVDEVVSNEDSTDYNEKYLHMHRETTMKMNRT